MKYSRLILALIIVTGIFIAGCSKTENKIEPIVNDAELEKCAMYTDPMLKYSCYSTKAFERGDWSICDNIQQDDFKANCLSQVAWKVNDSSLCNSMPASAYFSKDECIANIVVRTRNASGCGTLSRIDIQGNCYKEIAVATNNAALCEMIVTNDLKIWCNALLAKDADICSQITNESQKSACIISTAQVMNSQEVCDAKIKNAEENDWCRINVAIYNNDLSACDNLQNQSWSGLKGLCYSSMASKNKDTSICDQIQDNSTKRLCYFQIKG